MSAWMLALTLASHIKVSHQGFFYVMGKALSGELSCAGTGLVFIVTTKSQNPGPSFKMDLDFRNGIYLP